MHFPCLCVEEAWATALCTSVGFVNLSDATTENKGPLLIHGGNRAILASRGSDMIRV